MKRLKRSHIFTYLNFFSLDVELRKMKEALYCTEYIVVYKVTKTLKIFTTNYWHNYKMNSLVESIQNLVYRNSRRYPKIDSNFDFLVISTIRAAKIGKFGV